MTGGERERESVRRRGREESQSSELGQVADGRRKRSIEFIVHQRPKEEKMRRKRRTRMKRGREGGREGGGGRRKKRGRGTRSTAP